jgi:hypothetical protein
MRCQWHCKHKACGVIDNACTVLSSHRHRMESACGPIDREFTINQHFEQPLQPLKGISIKNIYSMFTNCPIPPLQIYGNLKGYLTKNCACCVIDTPSAIFVFRSRRIQSRIQKGCSLWIRAPGGYCLMKKPPNGQKSCDTVPLTIPGTTSGGTMNEIQLTITNKPEGK